MSAIDYIIIVVFMSSLVVIGFMLKSKSKGGTDFIVGGRSITMPIFIATYLATCIGGGVLNGWVGQVYSSGFAIIPSMITMYVLTVFLGLVLAAKLRKFGEKSGGLTSSQVMTATYSKNTQTVCGVFSFINLLCQGPCMQTITFGTVLNVITGIPFAWGCVISMAIICLYTYTAGFWGVAMTNYVQFILMAVGVGLGASCCFAAIGGWTGISAGVPAEYLQPTGSGGIWGVVKLAATTALPIVIDGNRYQQFYSCKDENTARKGTLLAIIPLHIFYMMILLLGLSAYILLPDIKPDAAFSSLLLQFLPIGLRGIIFGALLAAIMSTCSSYVLCGASTLTVDIYKNMINPEADEKQVMKMTRRSVLGLCIVGLIMAIWLGSIMSAWSLASAAYVGGCFFPMCYAILLDNARKSAKAANAAIICGGCTGVILELTGITPFGMPAVVCGALLSLIVLLIGTALDRDAKVVSLT